MVGSSVVESDVIVPLTLAVPVTVNEPGAVRPTTWTRAPDPTVNWLTVSESLTSIAVGELSTTLSVGPGTGVDEDEGGCQSGPLLKCCGPLPDGGFHENDCWTRRRRSRRRRGGGGGSGGGDELPVGVLPTVVIVSVCPLFRLMF